MVGFHESHVPNIEMGCPTCGVLPMMENGELHSYHKHDCPFHWRQVHEEQERRRRKLDKQWKKQNREDRIDYWRYRWKTSDIILTIVFMAFCIFLFLFFTGIVSLGE